MFCIVLFTLTIVYLYNISYFITLFMCLLKHKCTVYQNQLCAERDIHPMNLERINK